MVQDRLKGTENYMELMKNFQISFDELQEADEHPKRLGQKNS
ncbi:unnamed protein product [Chrysoparadoxa australica]